jgi:hypothetical protein
VKNRFQSLPFKCNLQRYNEVELDAARAAADAVGLHKSNAVDSHSVKAPVLNQPLHLN